MNTLRSFLAFAFSAFALLTAPALAAPGGLDSTFGTGGKVTTAILSGDDTCRSVAVQSDGRIVVAGYSSIGSNVDFALTSLVTKRPMRYMGKDSIWK